MGVHAFIQYLKYKWKAKSRHGTHSPFVYDLIRHVLLNKGPIGRAYIVEYPGLPLKYENLISRIAAYYKYKAILRLPLEKEETQIPDHADLLIFNEQAPHEWMNIMNEYYYLLKNESAVVVTGIHKTPEHTREWDKLCIDARVKMSIDVYGIGLLFFKAEFKEQQRFILKY
jgi:hypothetical protein